MTRGRKRARKEQVGNKDVLIFRGAASEQVRIADTAANLSVKSAAKADVAVWLLIFYCFSSLKSENNLVYFVGLLSSSRSVSARPKLNPVQAAYLRSVDHGVV